MSELGVRQDLKFYKYSYVVEATIRIIKAHDLKIGDVLLFGRQRAQVIQLNKLSNGQYAKVDIFGEPPDNGVRTKWLPRYDNYYILEKAVYRNMSLSGDDIDDGVE